MCENHQKWKSAKALVDIVRYITHRIKMTIKFQHLSIGCVLFIMFIYTFYTSGVSNNDTTELPVLMKNQKYRGYQYWNKNQTLSVQTLVETKFARAQLHSVKLENGDIINDWLWFDEGNEYKNL